MGSVNIRTSFTSRAINGFSAWNNPSHAYCITQLNLGNNFISKLEIVSSLNSFNLGRWTFEYNSAEFSSKYNPKVYLSAVQSVGQSWNSDRQNGQNWWEKSGS